MNTLKIGITQGDTNSVSYEMILKAFENPTMMELCQPVVYGSASVAASYRKELQAETDFVKAKDVSDVQEGRLNLVECTEGEFAIEMGTPTEASTRAALDSLKAALDDLLAEETDVLVTSGIDEEKIRTFHPEFQGEMAMASQLMQIEDTSIEMWMAGNLRVTFLPAEKADRESLSVHLKTLDRILKRDFLLSHSRIAILAPGFSDNPEVKGIVQDTLMEMQAEGVFAFGLLDSESFFGQREYTHYDCVLVLGNREECNPIATITDDLGILYHAGLPFVWTSPVCPSLYKWVGKGLSDPHCLLEALYQAKDIQNNRLCYDEAHENPLGKLYHDRREEKRNNSME